MTAEAPKDYPSPGRLGRMRSIDRQPSVPTEPQGLAGSGSTGGDATDTTPLDLFLNAADRLANTIAATERLTRERAELLATAHAAVGLGRPRARSGRGGVVSLAEAARLTGRHPEVLRRWCITGRLPAIRVGRTWAITADSVAMLREHGARSRPRFDRVTEIVGG